MANLEWSNSVPPASIQVQAAPTKAPDSIVVYFGLADSLSTLILETDSDAVSPGQANDPLHVGVYDNAGSPGLTVPLQPGLTVDPIGFACVNGNGTFNITALEMAEGYVERFTVGFVRYCADTDVPTVTGCLNLEHVPNSYQGGLWDAGGE
jgi:hypothetical protein